MLPEDNSRARVGTRHEGPPLKETDSRVGTSAKAEKKSIDVVFDLDDPGQAEKLESHKAAFGEANAEVVPLGDGKVVLKIYPGGARRLL